MAKVTIFFLVFSEHSGSKESRDGWDLVTIWKNVKITAPYCTYSICLVCTVSLCMTLLHCNNNQFPYAADFEVQNISAPMFCAWRGGGGSRSSVLSVYGGVSSLGGLSPALVPPPRWSFKLGSEKYTKRLIPPKKDVFSMTLVKFVYENRLYGSEQILSNDGHCM
jgi:hypothetical protein